MFTLLGPHFPIDPRRLTVLTALILAMTEGRTVYLDQLVSRIRLPGSEETLYQRLKRFVQFDWPAQQQLIAALILNHLQHEPELILIMDRTHWKWEAARPELRDPQREMENVQFSDGLDVVAPQGQQQDRHPNGAFKSGDAAPAGQASGTARGS
ncbi:hypothetical protein [Deinococcus alpinitundrae]|uniref:hypothetical protein n=1 Tax=Deinococcus alpinitundrae TaxID=468913 RepID=UPI001379F78F|nr:hypothetical protein [Deinococcus alpinitundrae]